MRTLWFMAVVFGVLALLTAVSGWLLPASFFAVATVAALAGMARLLTRGASR
jgi:hypothetical protein